MILEFTKTTSVYEKDAYINVNGEETIIKDLMITHYVPINFVGTAKNYLLGNEHPLWESKHRNFEAKILQEWLVELDYDPEFYYVDTDTKKIEYKQASIGKKIDISILPHIPISKTEDI